jgi:hypothetical protein
MRTDDQQFTVQAKDGKQRPLPERIEEAGVDDPFNPVVVQVTWGDSECGDRVGGETTLGSLEQRPLTQAERAQVNAALFDTPGVERRRKKPGPKPKRASVAQDKALFQRWRDYADKAREDYNLKPQLAGFAKGERLPVALVRAALDRHRARARRCLP